MRKARNLGYRSHQTSTCGLHIHINRNAFGDNQSEQEEAISKILVGDVPVQQKKQLQHESLVSKIWI